MTDIHFLELLYTRNNAIVKLLLKQVNATV